MKNLILFVAAAFAVMAQTRKTDAGGGDRPTRGFFVAFDAMTGREA